MKRKHIEEITEFLSAEQRFVRNFFKFIRWFFFRNVEPPKIINIPNPDTFIVALAEWWADKIFANASNCDNGEFFSSSMMQLFAGEARSKAAGKREIFIAAFSSNVRAYIQANDMFPCLEVDYHPSNFLKKVVEEIGIDPKVYPCKTFTIYDEGKVFGKCGYQAEWEELAIEAL